MITRGWQGTAAARRLPAPKVMSLEDIEAEVQALMDHERDLRDRPGCGRLRCDGAPHVGYPYEHEPKLPSGRTPLDEAIMLDPGYRTRPHLDYLAERLAEAVAAVERGESRFMTVSMPPRMGKSQLSSVYLPVWLLHRHPDWRIGLISHSPTLATAWGRQVRRIVETRHDVHGLQVAPDAGAVSGWETTRGGGVAVRSAPGQSITGLGFKVMIVDDPVKDFADAHSATMRDALWDWWTANAVTRLEPPALAIVIGTRWHEDDFIGRLLSEEHDGDPDDWEVISFPAFAEEADVLGRTQGEPLLSPLIVDETPEHATTRWQSIKRSVGTYSWAALFQQRPAPASGAVLDVGWWRYWTRDPSKVTTDGRVVLLPDVGASGRWLDSWDMAFKATKDSDYVVGQRWMKTGANRYLVSQQRGRWTFTECLARMKAWAEPESVLGTGRYVHQRLVEDAANGSAILDTLKDEISGLKPINPHTSKESRARAITPEIEAGNVFLPLPSEQEWVLEFLSEARAFPTSVNDDQVDAMTQALMELRETGHTTIVNPGDRIVALQPRIAAARTGIRRSAGG